VLRTARDFSHAFSFPQEIAARIFRTSRRNFELPVPEKAINERRKNWMNSSCEGGEKDGNGKEREKTERKKKKKE